MKFFKSVLGVILLQLSSQVAANFRSDCNDALVYAYYLVSFEGPGYGDYYGSICLNKIKLASILAAETVYCNVPVSDISQAIGDAEDVCAYGDYLDKPADDSRAFIEQVGATITQKFVDSLPVYSQTDDHMLENITKPFIIDQAWFDIVYRTTVSFNS